MTEKKTATSLTSEENVFTPSLLSTIIDSAEPEDQIKATTILLNPDVAKLFFKPFEIGEAKTILYGNPIIMSTKSKLFAGLLEEANTGPLLLAPGLTLDPYPESFLSVWLYMNGVTDQLSMNHTPTGPRNSYEDQKYKILARMLRMWDWIKYFQIDNLIDYFNRTAHDVWFHLHDLNPKLKEDKEIEIVRFSGEFLPNIKDLDEEMKSLAAEDKLITEQRPLDMISIEALFGFILGRYPIFRDEFFKLDSFGEGFDYGYHNKKEIKRRQKLAEKRQADVKRAIQINVNAWNLQGPAPYPKNYEYYWPTFYKNLTWEENRVWTDEAGFLKHNNRSAADIVPRGGNIEGPVLEIPPDYPGGTMCLERTKLKLPQPK